MAKAESRILKNQKDQTEGLRGLLHVVARQLNRWADESRRGGWSTHQVDPQRALAEQIHQHLDILKP